MSLYAYKSAIELDRSSADFYGLVMAAMLRADDMNLARLKTAFPNVWTELQHRYNAPQGLMPGETNPETGDSYEELMAIRKKVGLD